MAGFSLILVMLLIAAFIMGLLMMIVGTVILKRAAGNSRRMKNLGVALRVVSYLILTPCFAFAFLMIVLRFNI